MCCPYVILAQAHKKLFGGNGLWHFVCLFEIKKRAKPIFFHTMTDPQKGMIGYYVIIGVFVLVNFLSSLGGRWSPYIANLGWLFGVFVITSLLR
jgi:hypothetical protein